MISSKSFTSDLSKASSQQDSGTKTKKKRVFLALSRPSSSKTSKDADTKSLVSAGGTLKPPKTSSLAPPTTINKSSTLPRPPKTPKSSTLSTKPSTKPPSPSPSLQASSSSLSGATPLKKRLPFSLSSKTKTPNKTKEASKLTKTSSSNLSFSELKKQHQLLLQEVETLKTQLTEKELKNEKIVKDIQGKLEDSELSVTILKQDNETKDAIITEKETHIQELQSQLNRTMFDKERLLMVIESVQRDALTGEPIFHDDNLWQQAREENRSKMSHYTSLLDNMIATLQNTSTQLQEQEHCIKTSSQLVPQI